MIKTRKEKMLEARITRLERLLKSECRSSKFESSQRLPFKMRKQLRELFEDRLCGSDFWSVGQSNREFINHMCALSQGKDMETVDEVIAFMADDYGYDEDALSAYWDAFANELAAMADEVCEDFDDDEDEEDDTFEARKRKCERRRKSGR